MSRSVSMFISSASDSKDESAYVLELYAGDARSISSGDDGMPIMRYGECSSSMKSAEVSIISTCSYTSFSCDTRIEGGSTCSIGWNRGFVGWKLCCACSLGLTATSLSSSADECALRGRYLAEIFLRLAFCRLAVSDSCTESGVHSDLSGC
jgi:hypothetical protein